MGEKIKEKNMAELELRFIILRSVIAILIALSIVLVVIALVSFQLDDVNPVEAVTSFLFGPISRGKRFANVIEEMIPLTFVGIGLTIVFRTKRFNLAAEGAFYMGGMVSAMVALNSPFSIPLTIIIALFAGFIAGGLIGYIPAKLQAIFAADELVSSLMLNYVIAYLVNYLLNFVIRDSTKSTTQSFAWASHALLGKIIPKTRIHYGLLIMIALVIITWFIIYCTKWGYALRVTGENEKFSKYNGIKTGYIIIMAQVIGTAIAGLGGAVQIMGKETTFSWTSSPGYGFDGVIITTLANGNPLFIPIASFFLAYIRVGADVMNLITNIPPEVISIAQAVIIMLIAAQHFLAKIKHKVLVEKSLKMEKNIVLERGGQ
ncbi:MAG: ABC transporter permease [Lachnospirales bacterium]